MVALVRVAAAPRSFPVDHGSEALSVRRVAEHLRNAPSDGERRHLQDLTTTMVQNASFWIGASSKGNEVFSAIRNVLPDIEPDPRHLAAANLDPRRIAFLVVECARVEAPADFAEATTDTPDQAEINVHVLQTMILRSLEHLQRVALTEWTERNFEARRSVRVSEVASPIELRPDPSNDGFGERPPKLDLITDQFMSALAAELSNVGPAASALETPLPSDDGDLETSIKEVLNVQLNRREHGSPTPDMEVPDGLRCSRGRASWSSRRRSEPPSRNDSGRRNAA